MNEIQLLLNKIFNCLKRINSPLVEFLNDGIDKTNINTRLKKYNLEFPEEVYSLYGWKNGVTDKEEHLMGHIMLFIMGIFSSFDRSCNSYQEWCGKDRYWNKTLFPLFESGGAGFHLIQCDPSSVNYGMIYFYDISADEFDTIIGKYDSLKTLLQSVYDCYLLDIYTFNKYGIFTVIDYEKSFKISKKYNPRCYQYWNMLL